MGLTPEHCLFDTPRHQLIHEKFVNHVEEYGLMMGTKEEWDFRFQIFTEKDAYINKINTEQSSFTLGHNMFSTLTYEEGKKRLGHKEEKGVEMKEPKHLDDTNLSQSVDWRAKGGVNAVKNQGHCGSCWAFGSTAAIEFAHWHATKKLLSLSEQQLVSCAVYNYGCRGGWAFKAYDYVRDYGQELESDYAYVSGTSQVNEKCTYDKSKATVKIQAYEKVVPNMVSQLKAAIDKSVVSVTIEADQSVFQLYKSGVMDSAKCGT